MINLQDRVKKKVKDETYLSRLWRNGEKCGDVVCHRECWQREKLKWNKKWKNFFTTTSVPVG